MSRPLQAIIFDFDGVIADSERLHLRAYQEVLADEGITLTAEAYSERYLGYDDVGVFRALAKDFGRSWTDADIAARIGRKGTRYDALAAEGAMLFPGAAAFIRTAGAAVPVAIASGALSHEIHEVLDRAGLADAFVAVVGADHTARSKPNPDPYLEALARLENAAGRTLDPARTVAIEDSHWGLDAARAAGLRTVAVATTYRVEEIASAAEITVSGLGALDLAMLDRLCAS